MLAGASTTAPQLLSPARRPRRHPAELSMRFWLVSRAPPKHGGSPRRVGAETRGPTQRPPARLWAPPAPLIRVRSRARCGAAWRGAARCGCGRRPGAPYAPPAGLQSRLPAGRPHPYRRRPPPAAAVPPALAVTQEHGGPGCPAGRVNGCRGVGRRVRLSLPGLRRAEGLRGTGRRSLQRGRLGLSAGRARGAGALRKERARNGLGTLGLRAARAEGRREALAGDG